MGLALKTDVFLVHMESDRAASSVETEADASGMRLELAGGEVLLQSDEEQRSVPVRGIRGGGAERPRRRGDAGGAAQERAPAQRATGLRVPAIRMRVGHDVKSLFFATGPVMGPRVSRKPLCARAGAGHALDTTDSGIATSTRRRRSCGG